MKMYHMSEEMIGGARYCVVAESVEEALKYIEPYYGHQLFEQNRHLIQEYDIGVVLEINI